MAGVEAALEALQPVALLNMPRGEALRRWHQRPFQVRECGLVLGRPHIGPDEIAAFDAGIGLRSDLILHIAARRHAGNVEAGSVDVEFDPVIDAAQSAFLVAPIEQGCGPVRAVFAQQARISRAVAKKNKIFTQKPHAHWRSIRLFDLVGKSCGNPIPPHQAAHGGPGAHTREQSILFSRQHLPLLLAPDAGT